MLQAYLILSLPSSSLESSFSPKIPGSFWCRIVKNENLVTKCGHCYWARRSSSADRCIRIYNIYTILYIIWHDMYNIIIIYIIIYYIINILWQWLIMLIITHIFMLGVYTDTSNFNSKHHRVHSILPSFS